MILIDAYNALHVVGVLPPELAGLDVDGLARLVAASRRSGRPARLVCDGTAPLARAPIGRVLPEKGPRVLRLPDQPHIEIVYAGPGRDADSLIERLLESHTAPRRVMVVSSDRRLQAAARRRRARWLSSEQFLRSLARDYESGDRSRVLDDKPPVPLARPEVEQWLREFGYDTTIVERGDPEPRGASGAPEQAEQPTAPVSAGDEDESGVDFDDPLVREALEEWRDRIDPDDLDMSKWLDPPSED